MRLVFGVATLTVPLQSCCYSDVAPAGTRYCTCTYLSQGNKRATAYVLRRFQKSFPNHGGGKEKPLPRNVIVLPRPVLVSPRVLSSPPHLSIGAHLVAFKSPPRRSCSARCQTLNRASPSPVPPRYARRVRFRLAARGNFWQGWVPITGNFRQPRHTNLDTPRLSPRFCPT